MPCMVAYTQIAEIRAWALGREHSSYRRSHWLHWIHWFVPKFYLSPRFFISNLLIKTWKNFSPLGISSVLILVLKRPWKYWDSPFLSDILLWWVGWESGWEGMCTEYIYDVQHLTSSWSGLFFILGQSTD